MPLFLLHVVQNIYYRKDNNPCCIFRTIILQVYETLNLNVYCSYIHYMYHKTF